MPTRRVRVACFGAGWATTNRHIPALRAHGGFDVAAIADPDGERARDVARRLGIARAVQTDTVSDLPDIDAVTCGTPPMSHHAVARAALEAGLPVLVEKPFTLTVAEGEELIELARERAVPLAVMQNFCLAPSTRRVQRWIASGRLGAVRAVWAVQLSSPARRLPAWYDELPHGLFYDESPNLIALARLFAGGREPVPLSARVQPGRHGGRTPAQVEAALTAGDVALTLLMHFEAPVSEWHVVVVGDRALAIVDLFRDVAVFAPGDRRHLALDTLRTSAATTAGHWAGVARSGVQRVRGRLRYGTDEVVAQFHAAVTGGAPLGPIGADDALATTRLQHWIMERGACGSSS